LKISNNSGAKPGETITISVKKNIFKKHIIKKSKIIIKGQICKALIIRSIKGIKRWGNFFLRSNTNAAILLNRYDLPYGTRLFGIIFREIKKKMKYSKIISLADIVL
jgi:large subunit ribosomal protein L14